MNPLIQLKFYFSWCYGGGCTSSAKVNRAVSDLGSHALLAGSLPTISCRHISKSQWRRLTSANSHKLDGPVNLQSGDVFPSCLPEKGAGNQIFFLTAPTINWQQPFHLLHQFPIHSLPLTLELALGGVTSRPSRILWDSGRDHLNLDLTRGLSKHVFL